MVKALISLSGGMDSVTVLAEAIHQLGRENVECVGFRYGSKHNQYENEAARKVAEHYGVPFGLIDFSSVAGELKSNLLKTGGEIPEGHYEAKSMSQTVVPGRNLIFISILTGVAWSREIDQIWLGPHQGDHEIYGDCRPIFFHAMNAAVVAGSEERVELVAPYLHGDKVTILKRGLELGVPYYLTRTCYKDQPIACGKCGACQERQAGFLANGVEDPVEYEFRGILPKG